MAKRVYTQLAALTLFMSPILAWVPAEAQATKPSPAVAAAPSAEKAQIDGIMSNIVDDLWKQNDEYWHHGDYPRIVDLDRIIVQGDPSFLECYATGGWLMESLGRRKDAEAFYQLGVKNNPDASYGYYNLGMFYYNTLKDYPAAIAVFRRDAVTKDASANDYKMLAHSYERAGNLASALKTWQTVKKRWPKAPAVDANLTRVQAKIDVTSAG